MPTVLQGFDVPRSIRALVPDHDYVDYVTRTTKAHLTPEDLARSTVEGASPYGRFLAWRVACQFRLAPADAPDHIGGWRIAERGDTWIRLTTSGRLMTAHMVFSVEDGATSFATFLHYDRPIAARVWGTVSHVHRRAAPGFLAHGVRLLERSAVRP